MAIVDLDCFKILPFLLISTASGTTILKILNTQVRQKEVVYSIP